MRSRGPLLALTLSAAVTGCSHHTTAAPPRSAAATVPTPSASSGPATGPTLTSPNTVALERGLSSTQPRDVLPALAPALRARYATHPFPILPAGSTVHLEQSGMRTDGNLATTPATVTGPEPGRWLVLLVRDGARWVAYGTRKATP